MSETLYPHEAISKYIDKNIWRFDAAFSFIFAGMFFGIFLMKRQYNIPTNSMMFFIVFVIFGLISQYIDYKYRGIN